MYKDNIGNKVGLGGEEKKKMVKVGRQKSDGVVGGGGENKLAYVNN